ncbi:hypothetical protein [Methylosinus sp. Ce-a6]|uniref:hypothetical protein n=1 Tax=Methylosinus sp. Ce-a6 TaxID=2172005 RepID=UPI00135C066B|nr:hypothetical protein [Methylosinus sp. Ce-a6]
MRRTVRPFVKEFKSRSAKTAASRLAPLEEAAPEPKPAFLDVAAFTPRAAEREAPHDDGYEAAMRAADLVFGKKSASVEVAAPAAPVATGRVLPSLLETEAPTPSEPREPARRGPGRPRVKKSEEPTAAATPIRRPRRPAPTEPAQDRSPAPPIVVAAQPQPHAPIFVSQAVENETSRRIRRPIQLRYVLKTELRAGERWKRRLPEAAR